MLFAKISPRGGRSNATIDYLRRADYRNRRCIEVGYPDLHEDFPFLAMLRMNHKRTINELAILVPMLYAVVPMPTPLGI